MGARKMGADSRFINPDRGIRSYVRNRRAVDHGILIAFSAFALVSLGLEWAIALGVDLERASDPVGRAWAWYGRHVDPYLLHAPLETRVMFGIDAFVFGPFYVVLVYAFARQAEWIRTPALLYAPAMIYSVVVYYAIEAFAPTAGRTDFVSLVAISAMHTLMPFVLLARVWRSPLFPPR